MLSKKNPIYQGSRRFALWGVAGIASLVLFGCEPNSRENEMAGGQSANLVLNPNAQDTFAYLRSNVTGWNIDTQSLMTRTAEGVFEKEFEVNQQWMLDSGFSMEFILTNEENGWGTISETLTSPNQDTPSIDLDQPIPLIEGSGAFRFQVPEMGEYTLRLDLNNMTYTVGNGDVMIVKGDVNEDGVFSYLDVLVMHQYLAGLNPTPFNLEAADVSCDGVVNEYDKIRMTWAGVGTISIDTCPEAPPFNGDADNDGAFSSNDVNSISSYLDGQSPEPFDWEQADVDCDGTVSGGDMLRLGHSLSLGIRSYCPMGDVDADGVVNSLDIELMELVLAGDQSLPFNELAADVNCDGTFNQMDVDLSRKSGEVQFKCDGAPMAISLNPGNSISIDDFESAPIAWYSKEGTGGRNAWDAALGTNGSHAVSVRHASAEDDSHWTRLFQLDNHGVYSVYLDGRAIGFSPEAEWTMEFGNEEGRVSGKNSEVTIQGVTADIDKNVTSLNLGMSDGSGTVLFDNVNVVRHLTKTSTHFTLSYEPSSAVNMDEGKISEWLSKLDLAYNSYAELVGATPYEGQPIEIRSVRQFPGGWAVAGNPIEWIYDAVDVTLEDYQNPDTRDWSFGILHEIGHDFDLDDRWVWDAELWANIKMMYVLQNLGAKNSLEEGSDIGVRKKPRDGVKTRYGRNIAEFYADNDLHCFNVDCTVDACAAPSCDPAIDKEIAFDDCYDCKCNPAGQWECTYKYNDQLMVAWSQMMAGENGWTPMKNTFRYFNDLTEEEYDGLVDARVALGESERFAKYNLFMNRMSLEMNEDVRNEYFTQGQLDHVETVLHWEETNEE